MFGRQAVLVALTCVMTGACTDAGVTGPTTDSILVEGMITAADDGAPLDGVLVGVWYNRCVPGGDPFDIYASPDECKLVVIEYARSKASGRYRVFGAPRSRSLLIQASIHGYSQESVWIEDGQSEANFVLERLAP